MTTDTTEQGLETLNMRHMTGPDGPAPPTRHARRADRAIRDRLPGGQQRISLADVLKAAASGGLSDADVVAAVERLARPKLAGLRRFYVDRTEAQPRLVAPEAVQRQLGHMCTGLKIYSTSLGRRADTTPTICTSRETSFTA